MGRKGGRKVGSGGMVTLDDAVGAVVVVAEAGDELALPAAAPPAPRRVK